MQNIILITKKKCILDPPGMDRSALPTCSLEGPKVATASWIAVNWRWNVESPWRPGGFLPSKIDQLLSLVDIIKKLEWFIGTSFFMTQKPQTSWNFMHFEGPCFSELQYDIVALFYSSNIRSRWMTPVKSTLEKWCFCSKPWVFCGRIQQPPNHVGNSFLHRWRKLIAPEKTKSG